VARGQEGPGLDSSLHLLSAEGPEAFASLPAAIRNLGPWSGSREGHIDQLRFALRVMIGEQGFVLLYSHISQLQFEAADVRALPPSER
jgi:hypothetical protein